MLVAWLVRHVPGGRVACGGCILAGVLGDVAWRLGIWPVAVANWAAGCVFMARVFVDLIGGGGGADD